MQSSDRERMLTLVQPPFFSDTYKAVRNFGGIG